MGILKDTILAQAKCSAPSGSLAEGDRPDDFTDVLTASPIAVVPEMANLIDAAAHTWEPEVFRPSDFDGLPTRAFMLQIFTPGAEVNDATEIPNAWYWEVRESYLFLRQFMVFGPDAVDRFTKHPGERFATWDDHADAFIIECIASAARWGWRKCNWLAFGSMEMPWGVLPPNILNQITGDVNRAFSELQVALRLMTQTIATPRRVTPTHRDAKLLRKAKAPVSDVLVVTLRRLETPKHKGEESEPVNWTHRWLVGGHWRKQWYPTEQAHKQIWIAPYVKGPQDKPLKVKRRAYVFKR